MENAYTHLNMVAHRDPRGLLLHSTHARIILAALVIINFVRGVFVSVSEWKNDLHIHVSHISHICTQLCRANTMAEVPEELG